jgi:hypothetical protein
MEMEYWGSAEFSNYGTNWFQTGGTKSGATTPTVWKISLEKVLAPVYPICTLVYSKYSCGITPKLGYIDIMDKKKGDDLLREAMLEAEKERAVRYLHEVFWDVYMEEGDFFEINDLLPEEDKKDDSDEKDKKDDSDEKDKGNGSGGAAGGVVLRVSVEVRVGGPRSDSRDLPIRPSSWRKATSSLAQLIIICSLAHLLLPIDLLQFPCALSDAADPLQLGFQDAATPMMQGIIDLHHNIFISH